MGKSETTFFNVFQNLTYATRWLLAQQNKDGSWGNSQKEKIRWTSNAVISLSKLGLDNHHFPALKNAVDYLQSVPYSVDEWYLRIPALYSIGETEWLKERGDDEALDKLFIEDAIGNVSFKVALYFELLQSGRQISGHIADSIIKSILNSRQNEPNNLVSFGKSTNDTTLYANMLDLLTAENSDEYTEDIKKAFEWVWLRKIQDEENQTLCWEYSYGKTAYVCINILSSSLYSEDQEDLFIKILRFFKPLKTGEIPRDTIPAHESTSSIYTTILFIRAAASFLKRNSKYYGIALSTTLCELIYTKYKKRKYRHYITFISLLLCVIIFILLLFIINKVVAKVTLLHLIGAVVASLFGSLYLIFKTSIYKFFEKK